MTLDVYNFVVDMETDFLFWNKYCAQCNGYTQLRPIAQLLIYCQDYQIMHKAMDYEEMVNISLREPSCVLHHNLGDTDSSGCFPHELVIDRCNVTPSIRPYDEDVERACLEFNNTVDQVYVSKGGELYKNIFCFICNVNDTVFGKRDPTYPISLVLSTKPPFSQLIRFSSPPTHDDTIRRMLNLSQWSTADGTTKPLHCTPGKHLISGNCRTFNTEVTGLGYRLRIWFMLTPADVNLTLDSLVSISQSFESKIRDTCKREAINYSMEWDKFILSEGNITNPYRLQSPIVILADIVIVASKKKPRDEIEECLVKTLLKTPLTVARDKDVTCVPYVWLGDFENISLFEWCSGKFDDCFKYTWREKNSDSDMSVPKEPLVKVTNTLVCTFVSFNKTQYKVDEIKTYVPPTVTITVNLGNTKLIFSKVSEINMLEIVGDGVLNVCREALDEKLASLAKTPNELNYYANILTLTCMSASMLCLLVSLVTYIRFSELRNSAGKNNMFLCTSLLLAQASLLASSYLSGYKYICIALGMSTHFLWLWNFAWTFMCNFRMLQVFTAQVRIPQTPEDERRVLVKNIVLTLILPTVSVASVAVSSQLLTQGQKIGYGELTCLIDSSLLLGVFLISPLSLITVCNVAFFIATVVKIYTISRSVTQQDNFSTRDRQLSVVYVKLSLMTGAFWLFAIAVGVEAVGVEAVGVKAVGVEAVGVEAVGVEAVGVEAVGV
ncbi:uncharacterized protein LOC131951638 [Physella acuta]|uniref:uncharacterized protein LOC131951638 n=1 Tax=Physella acuta TaxID=109671 RepID=UPI0027DB71D7|nr:uncharacterized protein LOC131951638 [Physella acuta]